MPQTAQPKQAQSKGAHTGAQVELAAAICKRNESLRAEANVAEQVWRECFDYSFPLRGAQLQQWGSGSTLPTETQIGYGKSKQAALLDGTATESCNIMAASIVGGMVSASARWLGLDAGNESDEEQRWLDESAELLWENIHMANFDAEVLECLLDMTGAGLFALFIDEDRERGGFVFERWEIHQCRFASSRPGGRIDTVYREFSLTAEQALNEYGDALSEKIREAATREPDKLFVFIHAIYPRKLRMVGGRLAKNLPIASVHVEKDGRRVIRESGFHEMPVVAPRWLRMGPNLAVGPMFAVLPDCKSLNKAKFDFMLNNEMAAAGMYVAEDDGVLNPRTIKIGPRKVIVANTTDAIKPIAPAGKIDGSLIEIEKLQNSIRRALMADQLSPPKDGPNMTATEFLGRIDLLRQMLGPIFGRLQAEWLRPMVERCFGLAWRAGIFKRPPESLQDRIFSVTYLSPLARAQKLQDVAAMDRYEADLLQKAQAMPEGLDVYDWDEARREKAKLMGVPAKLIRDRKAIEAIRDARAAAAKKAQVAQAAGGMAGAVAAQQGGDGDMAAQAATGMAMAA